jgi:hypothetical protein
VAELASQHDDLAAMVTLVRREVRYEVDDIRRKVEPGNGRKTAAVLEGDLDEGRDGLVALLESMKELRRSHVVAIYLLGRRELGALGERLEPGAPRIVNVAGDHADASPGSARNLLGPKVGRKVLEEKRGDSMVRLPGSKNRFLEIDRGGHVNP